MQAFADPRDRALLGATPTVMMPRFGELDELEPGRRRFIAARDGLYMPADAWREVRPEHPSGAPALPEKRETHAIA